MPYTRQSRRRRTSLAGGEGSGSCLLAASDGGTGGDPGDNGGTKRQAVQFLRSHSSTCGLGPVLGHRNSQVGFSQQSQTVIVFDWDDTLFPTTYINDDLQLEWQLPLDKQRSLSPADAMDVQRKLSECEEGAESLIQEAVELAHVVVVTLASKGWVELACRHFYPTVGALLREKKIPVVYAQERSGVTQTQYDKLQFQSNEEVERFWGLVKGRAISEAVEKFYSQYEGQSWKNILSIGDSSFERYGLLAATRAYMLGESLTAASEGAVWSPTEEGCWQKVEKGHVKRLRAKCCKLVDQPDSAELTVELDMLSKWLKDMVHLDAGFDLDLEAVEDQEQVGIIEAVLRGQQPVSNLPRLAPEVDDEAGVSQ